MNQSVALPAIERHLKLGKGVWLFLDYDGTLVPIARTPDEAQPDAALLDLLSHLASAPQIRTVILSGRPLSSLRAMLPVPNVVLAGVYGVEIQTPGDDVVTRVQTTNLRPTLERVKSHWTRLVNMRNGFLIEDKGLAVALHARFATPEDADYVLPQARAVAEQTMNPEHFRLLGGNRFLEITPSAAHKGRTVEWLMDRDEFTDALPVYFGDDDKDEEAFAVVRQRGGISIAVGPSRGPTQAVERLPDPDTARAWLQFLWTERI